MTYKSPIRYAGNKYQLLPYILPRLPRNCVRMIDAFGGSGVVTLNMPMRHKLYNEMNPHTFSYVEALLADTPKRTSEKLFRMIERHKLQAANKQTYLAFREVANRERDPLMFYLLTRYSFSNLSRFNEHGDFTVAVGNIWTHILSESALLAELSAFSRVLGSSKRTNLHYAEVLTLLRRKSKLNSDTFVYCDPPYLASGTIPSYSSWSADEDMRLMRNLDHLTDLGVRWMMSNVFSHKSYENPILRSWARRYNVVQIRASYRFSRVKNQRLPEEVLILNY